VASTQLALFTAALNAAVVYMTWADGRGYAHFGVRGLFLVDGLAGAVALVPLLLLVRRGLPGPRAVELVEG
jgi:predicted MFS family arabinose efflux permease